VLCEVLDSYPIYKIINLVEASSLSEKNWGKNDNFYDNDYFYENCECYEKW
jgi:hypothetical protein